MSVEMRLILMAALVIALIIYRTGLFKKLKESREQKAADAEKKRLQEEKRARVAEAKRREEEERQKTLELLKRSTPGLAQRSTTAAGQEIWYLEGGAKSDMPTLLLLHGFAGDKENWAALARSLAQKQWHVIAPDLPGFGQNGKHDKLTYDVTTQAKRVRAFAQKIGLNKVHLVGCSMGATIAATYAYGSPKDVASLTLIEPFGIRLPYQSELEEMLAKDLNPLVIANPQAYDNLQSFLYANPPQTAPALTKYRAEAAATNRVFYLKVWKEIREGDRAYLLDLLLPELGVRTLIITGSKSRVVHSATSEVVRTMMPNSATAAVIEDCGHFVMTERPEETEKHLVDFLQAVSGIHTPHPQLA